MIRAEVSLAAPAEEVYALLADLPGYASWNPFTPGIRSTLVPGSPIELDVILHGRTHHQVETVLSVEPGRRLSWGLRMAGGLLLRSERIQTVTPIDPGRSRYVSEQRLEGPLAPLVRLLFGNTIRAGFETVCEALVRRFGAG